MNVKDAIKNTIDTGRNISTAYLSDLSDDDLMVRAVPGANHLAWQLGHMIASEHQMLSDVGLSMPALPDGFAEAYTKNTSGSDDAAKFHKKDQYETWRAEQRAATLALLAEIPEADLDKPTPEAMQEYAKTVGAVFNIIGIHEMMHAGQFVAIRRKLGKPVLI